jgi:hypothetical protein
MESREALLKNLELLGYNMLASERVDPLQTLEGLLLQKDERLLEGFPAVLSMVVDNKFATAVDVFNYFKGRESYATFLNCLLLAFAVYRTVGYAPEWLKGVLDLLTDDEREKVKELDETLTRNNAVTVGGISFSSERLKRTFERYKIDKLSATQEWSKRHSSFQFDFALSQLFTARQREILLKKARAESLSKTEQEYFSRVIKKKLLALANEEVRTFVKQIVTAL